MNGWSQWRRLKHPSNSTMFALFNAPWKADLKSCKCLSRYIDLLKDWAILFVFKTNLNAKWSIFILTTLVFMWTINHGTYYKLNISLFYQDVIAFPSVSYNLFKSSLQISSCIYYIITIKFDMAKIKSFPTCFTIYCFPQKYVRL